MAGKRFNLICVFILSMLVVAGARAQAPTVPSDVKAIEDKLRTGQPLTDAEEKRMDEWGDSLEAKPAAGTAGAGKNPFASTAQAAKSTSQSSTPCPPAHASLVTAAAPRLLKSCPETRPSRHRGAGSFLLSCVARYNSAANMVHLRTQGRIPWAHRASVSASFGTSWPPTC